MANTKISALTSGDPAQATDQVPVVRAGVNLKVSASSIGGVQSVAGKTGAVTLVESDVANLVSDLALKAPLASPALTGTPTSPTATPLTNTTQVASTAYADAAVAVEKARAIAAEGSPTMLSPGYFFPDNFLFEVWDPSNIDPRGGGTLSLCPSWKPFYLPFKITISRYRFQCDGVGTATGVFVYAGLYDKTGALIFDIGKVGVTTPGQYGPGAVHDPATVFFDASRNATSSVTLAAGWYYYGWGAEVATGSGLIFPQMGSTSALWDEQINIDTVGISPIVKRWGHSGGFDIAAGHMPTTIGRTFGGPATEPMNITFFV